MPSIIHFLKQDPALTPNRKADTGVCEMGLNLAGMPFLRDENGVITYLEKSSDSFLYTSQDIINNSNTVNSPIPELSFNVEVGKRYRGELWLSFASSLASNGPTFLLATPTGRLIGVCSSIASTDGTAATFSGALSSSSDSVISTSVQTANTEYLAKIEFLFIALANGIITPQFRSEVNGNNITIFNGSILTLLNY